MSYTMSSTLAISSPLDLPIELVTHITTFLDPPASLEFALTCKAAYKCASKQLALNKDYCARYLVSHDRQPLNIPSLLRKILNDDNAAWHLRRLEFWANRGAWKDWTSLDLHGHTPFDSNDPRAEQWPEPFEDKSNLDESFFNAEEICQYRAIVRQMVCADTSTRADEWMEKLESGDDEVLKCMLIAMAPKLDTINFVSFPDETDEDTPLKYLGMSIRNCWGNIGTRHNPWPPGFASLRSIIVNAGSDLRNPGHALSTTACEIAPFFLLPNIETLKLNGVYWDDYDVDYHLPIESSSVKHLTFDCPLLSDTHYMKMISSASNLRSLTLVDGVPDGLLEFLAANCRDSLEVLRIEAYGFQYDDPFILRSFSKLKVIMPIHLSIAFIITSTPEGRERECAYLRGILPTSVEDVYFLGNFHRRGVEGREDCSRLLEILADLAEDSLFADLHTIDLSGTELDVEPSALKCNASKRLAGLGVKVVLPGDDRSEVFEISSEKEPETVRRFF